MRHVLEYCPEIKMILGMKLDNDKPATIQKIEKDAKVAATKPETLESMPNETLTPAAASAIPIAEHDDSPKLESQAISLTGDSNTVGSKPT